MPSLRLVNVAIGALLLAAACDASRPCVYTARLYHVEASCLDPYAPIGLVRADALDATCPGVCLEQDGQLYVSNVCPPFPSTAQVLDEPTPTCEQALALLPDEAACE